MSLEKTTKNLKIGKSNLYKITRNGKTLTAEIEIGQNKMSSETTDIYAHVNKANIAIIRNPSDSTFKEEGA